MLYCNECKYALLHAQIVEKRADYRRLEMLCTNCGALNDVTQITTRKASPELLGKKNGFQVAVVRRLVDVDTEER